MREKLFGTSLVPVWISIVPVTFISFSLPIKSPFFSMIKAAASPSLAILGCDPHFHSLEWLVTTDFSKT